jgi:hypothetical protein
MHPKFNNAAALLPVTFAIVCIASGSPKPAAALEACHPGQRVVVPGGRIGTVVAVQGSGCTVRRDGDSFTDVFAAFMLDAAPNTGPATPPAESSHSTSRPQRVRPAANSSSPQVGTYQCVSGAAGNLVIRIMPGSRYANAQGVAGRFSINSSGRIAFVDGPWTGYFGRVLDGGRLGLTADPASTFYQMTCDRRN